MLNILLQFFNFIFLLLIALIFLLDEKSFERLHNTFILGSKSTIDTSEKVNMETLNTVDIDEMGRFKYIMVKVLDPNTQNTKIIVRGFQWANYHADIADNFTRVLQSIGMSNLQFSILGGGRIYHEPNSKVIKVYGYSEAYGKANHELAAQMIREKFPNYQVTWTDDGY